MVMILHVLYWQVIKSGTTSRAPDCFVRIPRRVNIADGGQILTFTVDGQG